MANEKYVLVVWEEGGLPNIDGLYPNNEATFNYLKQLLVNDIQQWTEEVVKAPGNCDTIAELYAWYSDQTQETDDYWRVTEISPMEAPQSH